MSLTVIQTGLGRMGLRAIFDGKIEECGILSKDTGKIWYEDLVGGMRYLGKDELPSGAVFGLDFKSTFRLNTQVYLNWYAVLRLCLSTNARKNNYSFSTVKAPSTGLEKRHQDGPKALPVNHHSTRRLS
jgi:hypothetical protein